MTTSPLPTSAGARFRQALKDESPLQVIGAINANHALLAKRAGYRAIYLSGGGVAAGSAGPARPGHQHARRRADRRAPHHRRVRPAADGRHRHRLRPERVQHRAHRQEPDQVPAPPPATSRTRWAPSAAATARARKSSPADEMVDRVKAAADARTDANFFLIARTDAIQVDGVDAAIERAVRLRRGRRRRHLRRGRLRPAHLPPLRRRREGAGAGQHHRVRHRRRCSRVDELRSAGVRHRCCTRCRRSAR